MRYRLLGFLMMLFSLTAAAEVNVSIGINLPGFPVLERVPGYPVYYAPRLQSNYFFYDGLYWIYDNDNWYASSWYNGPWGLVDRFDVPVYLLRVPVRYYRHAPIYFSSWRRDAPPRWGEHWGSSWEQRRSGWDRWNRSSAPAPAPLPTYQRQYSGSRYPQAQEQAVIQTRNYRYQPRDTVARQHFERVRAQAPAAQPQRTQPPRPQQAAPAPRAPQQQGERAAQRPQSERTAQPAPAARPQSQRVERAQQPAPAAREKEVPPGQVQRAERGKEVPKGQVQRTERPQPQAQAKGRDKDDKDDKDDRKGRDR